MNLVLRSMQLDTRLETMAAGQATACFCEPDADPTPPIQER
jgi:hypothetical protein